MSDPKLFVILIKKGHFSSNNLGGVVFRRMQVRQIRRASFLRTAPSCILLLIDIMVRYPLRRVLIFSSINDI